MTQNKSLGRAALLIQKTWRRVKGKTRTMSKRSLDRAAKVAIRAVDPRSLSVGDVKELGRRIQNAVEEPLTVKYPPDEVLFLIRMTAMIIQGVRSKIGLADYNFLKVRHYREVDSEDMNWIDAYKVCNRSERLLRIIRALAYGPTATPPRLLHISPSASLLFQAQQSNPRWNVHTFETMGSGSKFACQLFHWLTSVVEIAQRQQEFLAFIASSFPDWLPTMYEHQDGEGDCRV
jgi:hypothetical protein